MDDFKHKLQEGLTSLAEAGHDLDKLGAALVKIHGALEDYFRQRLHPKLTLEEQERSEAHQLGWVELVNLWERHFGLPMEQRRTILTKNGQRNDFAHGKSLTISRGEIESYAHFVQQFTGTRLRSQRHPGHEEAQAAPLIVDSEDTRIEDVVPARDWRPWRRRLGNVALLSFAGVTLLFWNGWLETAVLLLIIAIPLFRQQRGRAVYNYVGGLMFGYLQQVVGLTLLLAALGGLLWPLSLGGLFMQERIVEFVETVATPLPTPPVNTTDAEPVLEEEAVDEKTAVPLSTPPSPSLTDVARLQIKGNSNVRAGPGTTFEPVGYAQNGTIYDILETSVDGDWYKIRLENGREGWIGSSRVQLLPP